MIQLDYFQYLRPNDTLMQAGSKVKPYEENFGNRFFARLESINFRLQAPIDGDKGPLGQVCCFCFAKLVIYFIYIVYFFFICFFYKLLNISMWL